MPRWFMSEFFPCIDEPEVGVLIHAATAVGSSSPPFAMSGPVWRPKPADAYPAIPRFNVVVNAAINTFWRGELGISVR